MSETNTWLITGSSRGLGLEITRQLLLSSSNVVIATCRSPDTAKNLHALKNDAKGTLHILSLDTGSFESIEAVKRPVEEIVGDHGLDYLLNNAGMNVGNDAAFDFKPEDLATTFQINVVGPAHLTWTLLPLLERGKRKVIMNMSSSLGSIALDSGPVFATYSVSKAAVNMLTYKQSKLKPDFIIICLDPGWVKTDMGGAYADLEPETSVAGVLKVLLGLTAADNGKFFCHNGSVLPW